MNCYSANSACFQNADSKLDRRCIDVSLQREKAVSSANSCGQKWRDRKKQAPIYVVCMDWVRGGKLTETGRALRSWYRAAGKLPPHELSRPAGAESVRYVQVPEIREYRPGSACKRWLMPGYGSTVMWVERERREGDRRVAPLSSRRTVNAGGACTAGAYETIFDDVAEDIARTSRRS